MPTVEQAQAWYPVDDPVHGFDHVLRVMATAERLARAIGADLEIVRAAALLHDAAGAAPGDDGQRAEHEMASAEFARQILTAEGWPAERIHAVQACIRSHRYRSQQSPQSPEAKALFDADKLDVVGAFGIARTLGYAQQAGQPAYFPPSNRFLASGEREPGEPHSAYHEYLFKLRRVADRLQTEPARLMAEARMPLLQTFFEQLAAEASGRL